MISSTYSSRTIIGHEQALRLVGLVDGQRVVGNQVGERVGDEHEERVQALLGEHLVEHVCEPAVRLDDRSLRRHGKLPREEPEVWFGWCHDPPPDGLNCERRRMKLLARRGTPQSIALVRVVHVPQARDSCRSGPEGLEDRIAGPGTKRATAGGPPPLKKAVRQSAAQRAAGDLVAPVEVPGAIDGPEA